MRIHRRDGPPSALTGRPGHLTDTAAGGHVAAGIAGTPGPGPAQPPSRGQSAAVQIMAGETVAGETVTAAMQLPIRLLPASLDSPALES